MARHARPDPTQAVAYIRVSTEEQRNGPKAQRDLIQAWARVNGITILAVHEDLGASGALEADQRPGLTAAVNQLLGPGKGPGLLLVAKRDRLARDPWVTLSVERKLRGRNVRIVSCDGAGNGDAPADEFMRGVIDAAAAFERRMIGARTKDALAAKRARGEVVGSVPYGTRREGKMLVPDPVELDMVARARELRLEGRSYRECAAILAAEGYWSRAAKPLHPNQVRRMLSEPSH